MSRIILTFNTMFDVLEADRLLRGSVRCRPTPTPQGLSASVCGIAIELLEPSEEESALARLADASLPPEKVHHLP